MRKLILAALTLLCIVTTSTARKTTVPKMYMFGFAASFNDTIVHYTDIQELDSVWIESKNKFLLGREEYSYQLRDYLAQQKQMPCRTCIVIFGQKRKDVEKKFMKMMRLYKSPKNGQQHYDVRNLPYSEFHFNVINMADPVEEPEETEAAKKE